MKKTIQGFVHIAFDYDIANDDFEKKWQPVIKRFKFEDAECIFISEQQFTVEIPDDFDPVPGQIAGLEAQKREALAEYQRTIAEINDRLSKLQAIEFAP